MISAPKIQWDGGKLKEARRRNRLSRKALKEKLGNLKVSIQTIASWECGTVPKGKHLVVLSQILKVDPDYFFKESDGDIVIPSLHRNF